MAYRTRAAMSPVRYFPSLQWMWTGQCCGSRTKARNVSAGFRGGLLSLERQRQVALEPGPFGRLVVLREEAEVDDGPDAMIAEPGPSGLVPGLTGAREPPLPDHPVVRNGRRRPPSGSTRDDSSREPFSSAPAALDLRLRRQHHGHPEHRKARAPGIHLRDQSFERDVPRLLGLLGPETELRGDERRVAAERPLRGDPPAGPYRRERDSLVALPLEHRRVRCDDLDAERRQRLRLRIHGLDDRLQTVLALGARHDFDPLRHDRPGSRHRGLQPDPDAGVEIPWHCGGRRRRGRQRAHQSRDACLRLHFKRWLRDLDEKVASWEPWREAPQSERRLAGPSPPPAANRPPPPGPPLVRC